MGIEIIYCTLYNFNGNCTIQWTVDCIYSDFEVWFSVDSSNFIGGEVSKFFLPKVSFKTAAGVVQGNRSELVQISNRYKLLKFFTLIDSYGNISTITLLN